MTKAVVQNKICAYVLVDMAFDYTIVRMIFYTKVEEVSDAVCVLTIFWSLGRGRSRILSTKNR